MILAYPHPPRPQPGEGPWWRSREKAVAVAFVVLVHGAVITLAARQLAERPPPEPAFTPIAIQLEAAPPPSPVEPTTQAAPTRPTVSPRPTPAPTPEADPILTPLPIGPIGKLDIPVLPSIPTGPANGAGVGGGTAPDPVIRAPGLLRAPTADEMARFYPDRAQRVGVTGTSVVECAVTAEGRAERCRVLAETPDGQGFGDAALRLADRFRLTPKTVDGKAVGGGVIRIPLRWKLD